MANASRARWRGQIESQRNSIHLPVVSCARQARQPLGLRRQSAAATALSCGRNIFELKLRPVRAKESGVALRLPPQSKTRPDCESRGKRASVVECAGRAQRRRRFRADETFSD